MLQCCQWTPDVWNGIRNRDLRSSASDNTPHSFGFAFGNFALARGNIGFQRHILQPNRKNTVRRKSVANIFSLLLSLCSSVFTVQQNRALIMHCSLSVLRHRLSGSCAAAALHHQGSHNSIHHFRVLLHWQGPALRTLLGICATFLFARMLLAVANLQQTEDCLICSRREIFCQRGNGMEAVAGMSFSTPGVE